MGKRMTTYTSTEEPRENRHLPPRSHPSAASTPELKRRKPRRPAPGTGSGSESDPSPPSTPCAVCRLLEPYSKPRLLAILAEAAASDPALRARLGAAADASPSHCRLFVHGLPPHADGAALAEAFSRFGPLAGCRATGRCKGAVSAQFASAGPGPSGGGGGARRRVYVTNVAPDAGADRLRAFFARFGELEGGPFGFDAETGASRGYALFVYRAAAGAAKAVEEPYRVFEGRTLRCQLANEAARKTRAPEAPPPAVAAASAAGTPHQPAAVQPPALQSVLDAIAAAGVRVRDLATYAREPTQAAALLGQNPALAAAALCSALASAAVATGTPSPAAVSAPMEVAVATPKPVMEVAVATPKPVTAVSMVPSPDMVGVRPSGGAGLLGPYKPPSLPVVSSSSRKKGTMMRT
ncbi:hypothetical protein BS78_05G200800 [Paspalum vaginatum]|nr:hypothetical protein BS78_05G200800 [Paspalum vaginatum]